MWFDPTAPFAPIGIVGRDGQIEAEASRLQGLPVETRTIARETGSNLPSLVPGATAKVDVTGGLRRCVAGTSSIAFMLGRHVRSNNTCA